jgi:hypothetical protein
MRKQRQRGFMTQNRAPSASKPGKWIFVTSAYFESTCDKSLLAEKLKNRVIIGRAAAVPVALAKL